MTITIKTFTDFYCVGLIYGFFLGTVLFSVGLVINFILKLIKGGC